ncbi:AraC family transcriptional regulator [Pseudomonas nitroreducens]|uniref:AraC family transcriptional regulator n=1 Tax=Pseudomonas nitroreducens TaxID=46680 RepID=UPI00209F91A7|nr:AraC family transcriptional regulator [Pseudomonas nitroreducens]MCP1623770.1 AraC-like DNA-binding protein [Pseudomonas nitroreducens]
MTGLPHKSTPLPPSTLATVVRCIATTLSQHYAIDPLPLLQRVGIDPGILQDIDARLPMSAMSPLWLLCVEATGDADFGVRAVRYHQSANLYGMDLALYACPTLGEAVQRHIQLVNLASTVGQPSLLRDEQGDWRMEFRVQGDYMPTTVARDFYWHFHVRMFERLTGKPASTFLRGLELARESPADLGVWESLQVPVKFALPVSALVFRQDAWELPLPGANPRLLAQVERPILQYLAQHGMPLPLSALRARLSEQLTTRHSLETLAGNLGIARAQLDLTLQQHGVSFSQLLDQTREAQALQLLRDPQWPMEQIAERIGFSSASSLVRAFRRWQGMTPLAYRKRELGLRD